MTKELPKAITAYASSIHRAKEIYAKELVKVSEAITEAINDGKTKCVLHFSRSDYDNDEKVAFDAITTVDMLVALEGYSVSNTQRGDDYLLYVGWSAFELKQLQK
jgi:glutathionyl-hydroquinone reductase